MFLFTGIAKKIVGLILPKSLSPDKWVPIVTGLLLLCAIVLVVLLFSWIFGSCGGSATIDEEALQKINSEIDERRDAAIEKILIDNEVIEKSVNDRTEESERKLKIAEEKVKEAREFDKDVSAEDLKKILEETK